MLRPRVAGHFDSLAYQLHAVCIEGAQKLECFLRRPVEPILIVMLPQYHRHAVVIPGHERVWFCRGNRKGIECHRASPVFPMKRPPQSGERKRPGTFIALPDGEPMIHSRFSTHRFTICSRWHDAPSPAETVSPEARRSDFVAAGIGYCLWQDWLAGSFRNLRQQKPPVGIPEFPLTRTVRCDNCRIAPRKNCALGIAGVWRMRRPGVEQARHGFMRGQV